MKAKSPTFRPRRVFPLAALLLLAGACAQSSAYQRATSAPAPVDTTADHGARSFGDAASVGASPSSARVASDSEWKGRPAAQVEELLVGRFAGVQVQRTPGGMAVRIRGAGGFMNPGEPLFVIDGMPVDVGSEGLVMVNPSDVASIEVLNDPTSLAQWGSRGGNGVVLITTKHPDSR